MGANDEQETIMATLRTLSQSCTANVFEVVACKPLTNDDMIELMGLSKGVAYATEVRDQSIVVGTSNLSLIVSVYDKLMKKGKSVTKQPHWSVDLVNLICSNEDWVFSLKSKGLK